MLIRSSYVVLRQKLYSCTQLPQPVTLYTNKQILTQSDAMNSELLLKTQLISYYDAAKWSNSAKENKTNPKSVLQPALVDIHFLEL